MPTKNMVQRLAGGRAEFCFMSFMCVGLERLANATVASTQTVRHYNGNVFFVVPHFSQATSWRRSFRNLKLKNERLFL